MINNNTDKNNTDIISVNIIPNVGTKSTRN